jgi:hypothetical protein
MTNADSSSSKARTRLKTAGADVLLLAGLGLASCGVFKLSIAAGLIVTGLVLMILARAITPDTKKN